MVALDILNADSSFSRGRNQDFSFVHSCHDLLEVASFLCGVIGSSYDSSVELLAGDIPDSSGVTAASIIADDDCALDSDDMSAFFF